MTAVRLAPQIAILLLFLMATVALRGRTIVEWSWLNPDEAELIAQARAALLSPVPFTTWTMGTTGPFWVLTLAALGAIGFPLTLAFAHLFSAVLVGVMGYLIFLLMRRSFGLGAGIVLAIFWWLPIALIFPVGGRTDFGALTTEMLPAVLLLGAALVPPTRLVSSPWLFTVAGVLCGLAFGSKYQVLPIIGALLVVQLMASFSTARASLRLVLWWLLGAAAPFVPVVLAVVLSSDVSLLLVQQNLGFLSSYVGGLSWPAKLANTITLISVEKYLVAALAVVIFLSIRSTRLVILGRVLLIASGLAALLIGGNGFGHYMLLLLLSFGLATSLPVKQGTELVRARGLRIAVVAAVAGFSSAVIVVGSVTGQFAVAKPGEVAAAVSSESVLRNDALAALCPADSEVLVWGWAPELYIHQSWRNTVPFMNTLGLRVEPAIREASAALVERAIDESDCIVDAVGVPFFGPGAAASITAVYPEFTAELVRQYSVAPPTLDCVECTVYVRD